MRLVSLIHSSFFVLAQPGCGRGFVNHARSRIKGPLPTGKDINRKFYCSQKIETTVSETPRARNGVLLRRTTFRCDCGRHARLGCLSKYHGQCTVIDVDASEAAPAPVHGGEYGSDSFGNTADAAYPGAAAVP
jgi:hypothetical protein